MWRNSFGPVCNRTSCFKFSRYQMFLYRSVKGTIYQLKTFESDSPKYTLHSFKLKLDQFCRGTNHIIKMYFRYTMYITPLIVNVTLSMIDMMWYEHKRFTKIESLKKACFLCDILTLLVTGCKIYFYDVQSKDMIKVQE